MLDLENAVNHAESVADKPLPSLTTIFFKDVKIPYVLVPSKARRLFYPDLAKDGTVCSFQGRLVLRTARFDRRKGLRTYQSHWLYIPSL